MVTFNYDQDFLHNPVKKEQPVFTFRNTGRNHLHIRIYVNKQKVREIEGCGKFSCQEVNEIALKYLVMYERKQKLEAL